MRIFLSGGAVRDLLLGREATDKDYLVFDAEPDEFLTAFPRAQRVGKSFPVFMLDGSEYVFPRALPLEKDLQLRDLTVNAMLLGPDCELICHEKALDDISNRVLRPASDRSMTDDPLRVIRSARFSAQLPEFTVLPELLDAMRDCAGKGLLDTPPPDRVAREVEKAMNAPRPGNFLRTLAKADCLEPWFNEFAHAASIPAGPPEHHDSDVLEHTCRVMDECAKRWPGNALTVWMALCHDLGKTSTPDEDLPKHIGHEGRGEAAAGKMAMRNRMPNRFLHAGITAAAEHMKAARYLEMRPAKRVDLIMRGRKNACLRELFRLVLVDSGIDLRQRVREDTKAVLGVKLPAELQNLGEESGKRLREMRAAEITRPL